MASYQTVTRDDTRELSDFLSRNGQLLLPMVQLIEQSRAAIDEVIDCTGRTIIELILNVSAEQLAGPRTPGKKSGDVRHHGTQDGVVHLKERKLRVKRPRLRHRTDGEVDIPAYESMRTRPILAERMMRIMIDGVSTRRYKSVIPEMAQSVGISKIAVSRANIEAGETLLKELAERRFDHLDILIVYLDAIVLGDWHVLGAIGVDSTGEKHVLGLRPGSSENSVVATDLLNDLVAKGVKPDRHRLFVIDGAKALRLAIDAVYGSGTLQGLHAGSRLLGGASQGAECFDGHASALGHVPHAASHVCESLGRTQQRRGDRRARHRELLASPSRTGFKR